LLATTNDRASRRLVAPVDPPGHSRARGQRNARAPGVATAGCRRHL